MSADTDRFGERLANVEGQLEQISDRLGGIESRLDAHDGRFDTLETRIDRLDDKISDRFDTLDAKIEQNRREMRRLLLVLFAGLSVVVAVVSIVVQLAL